MEIACKRELKGLLVSCKHLKTLLCLGTGQESFVIIHTDFKKKKSYIIVSSSQFKVVSAF